MPTKYFKATFSNGKSIVRSTASRDYAAAYLATGTYPASTGQGQYDRPAGTWEKTGFSSSLQQASKNMDGETAWYRNSPKSGYTIDFAEAAAAIEITPKEYRALKAAS